MAGEHDFEDRFFLAVDLLINTLYTLEWCGRHFGAHNVDEVNSRLVKTHQELLRIEQALQEDGWPEHIASFRESLAKLVTELRTRLDAWISAEGTARDFGMIHRILRARPLLCEQLYPLTRHFSLIHRYFLDEEHRNTPVSKSTNEGTGKAVTGIIHIFNDRDTKGGYSLYVPENYDPAKRYPVVCALHGGSGHGSRFLWSWLRTVRSQELVLISPTSVGSTWALMGHDEDSGNLTRILDEVSNLVNINSDRLLLTGMSDGGTFTYVSGCQDDSPFTHLAPCSASFHPMLIEMFSSERLRNLPICITHGVLDWMFGVDVAQTAEYAFTAAGSNVFYREIEDLAHTYPEERNPELVEWFLNTDTAPSPTEQRT